MSAERERLIIGQICQYKRMKMYDRAASIQEGDLKSVTDELMKKVALAYVSAKLCVVIAKSHNRYNEGADTTSSLRVKTSESLVEMLLGEREKRHK